MTVSSTDYRSAISRFLTGVSVVTTRHDEQCHGITASALASVSLEPPTLLVCLNRHSATCQAVTAAGFFAVNILAAEQEPLAKHFAAKLADKFAGIATTPGISGAPLLDFCLAQLECRVSSHTDSGTHRIFFGEVLSTRVRDGQPLGYFRGGFSTLLRL
jgi:flavin reductase (DIM6/NTAB) family NADH-FMN oxidoreductase RutF